MTLFWAKVCCVIFYGCVNCGINGSKLHLIKHFWKYLGIVFLILFQEPQITIWKCSLVKSKTSNGGDFSPWTLYHIAATIQMYLKDQSKRKNFNCFLILVKFLRNSLLFLKGGWVGGDWKRLEQRGGGKVCEISNYDWSPHNELQGVQFSLWKTSNKLEFFKVFQLALEKRTKNLSAGDFNGPHDKLLLGYCFSGSIKQWNKFLHL